jgi:HlyD family secretion protein
LRNRLIIFLAVVGIAAALVSAYLYAIPRKPLPPVFAPASNPYLRGVYANGIIESYQGSGANINIYPEVSGTITKILAAEGQAVREGTPLLMIEDSEQRALVAQRKAEAEAALAVLNQLKAQPRKETLAVAAAQVELARANLKNVQDQRDKIARSYQLDPLSVSKNDLDNAENAVRISQANLDVASRQYELTWAGAWIYDIINQQRQYKALSEAYLSSYALLGKYVLKAPTDGQVIAMNVALGDYVSPLGAYNTYTQGQNPPVVMSCPEAYYGVRCYVDEILLPRLPPLDQMRAQMSIRGSNIKIPLEVVRVQPYVIPKIELSDQRTERVDVRVLPVIFRFQRPSNVAVYPGQLVDVYIQAK